MNSSQQRPRVHVPLDVVADAHQLVDVLTGVHGLLLHPHRGGAVEAARGAALECRAIAERVAAHLDALAAIDLEEQRAEQRAREAK